MRARGALGVCAALLLAGCGGAAAAGTPATPPEKVDVESVALDEVAALDELGYPVDLATWQFPDELTNAGGGTAWTTSTGDSRSVVQIGTDADAYLQFGPDVEASVRSTVRHEFGHVLTNYLYPHGSEQPLSLSCKDSNAATVATGGPAGECAAEAVSAALAAERGDEQVRFYDLVLSDASLAFAPPVLRGAPTWPIPGQ